MPVDVDWGASTAINIILMIQTTSCRLARIVTPNSIIIIDFIQLGILRRLPLDRDILESVSVRLRLEEFCRGQNPA